MSDPLTLLLLLPLACIIGAIICLVLPRRIRMERHAKRLLQQMPRHERKMVYLTFTSRWWKGKGKEMDAKIAEEEKAGWRFLKASEANPLKTIRSWGGGINLHFIRSS